MSVGPEDAIICWSPDDVRLEPGSAAPFCHCAVNALSGMIRLQGVRLLNNSIRDAEFMVPEKLMSPGRRRAALLCVTRLARKAAGREGRGASRSGISRMSAASQKFAAAGTVMEKKLPELKIRLLIILKNIYLSSNIVGTVYG